MKHLFRLISLIIFFQSTYSLAAKPSEATQGMVVTEQALASDIGRKILQAGGNAIDAAVAVGYALAVVNPCCGNIGGGGFMTIHFADGRSVFLNFRERAPALANASMFLDKTKHAIPEKSTIGYLAVGVPGTVLGFETALKKYGTLSRQQVIAPAIQLAEKGFVLTAGDVKLLDENLKNFRRQKSLAPIFLNHGKPFQVGDRLIQTDLAHSLKLISEKGSTVFYKGKIAEEIVNACTKNGGILSLRDFSHYKVEIMQPVYCEYRGYQIISAPPPSSGGTTLCEALNILERYPLAKLGKHSAEGIHYIVEAMRFSFKDRNGQLGDPDFVHNPVMKLTSKQHADSISQKIKSDVATPSISGVSKSEGQHTTHYSIVDNKGNAVSVTYTLNSFFGAQVIADNTGIILNNEMDDFTTEVGGINQFGLVQSEKNNIQPGKRPLSSMTPTIILKDNQVVMIVGSPGGPRIITSTLLTILNVIDYGMNIQDAVNTARFHHQWLPDTIYMEPDVFDPHILQQLKTMHYHLTPNKTWSAVEAIYINPTTHKIYGANDKRRSAGKAAGY